MAGKQDSPERGKRKITWECYIRMAGFPIYFFIIAGAAHGMP